MKAPPQNGLKLQKCQCHEWPKKNLENFSSLKDTKETWQLNAMHVLWLEAGFFF